MNDLGVNNPVGHAELGNSGGDSLEHIRSLTHRMLEAARSGEWGALVAMEGERREKLQQFTGLFSVTSNAPLIARVIEEILAIDIHTMSLCEKERLEALKGLQEVNHARQADSAYGVVQID